MLLVSPVSRKFLPLPALFSLAMVLSGLLLTAQAQVPASANRASAATAQSATIASHYGKLPISFEANQGQAGNSVKFLAHGNGYGLYLTGQEAVLELRAPQNAKTHLGKHSQGIQTGKDNSEIIRMQLSGSNAAATAAGVDRLAGTANYFLGSDPSRWKTGVPTYSKVRFSGVYPGVDLVYYGNQSQLEYDFVVAPHADPQAIRLHFAGAEKLALSANGDLSVIARNGQVDFHKPVVYQMKNGQRQIVEGQFALLTANNVSFSLGSYDHSQPLIVDPVLGYSTYLSGPSANADNQALAIAVDSSGDAYITGYTGSTKFPVTSGAYQTTNKTTAGGGTNVFVTKMNATGTALVYSTYLGGTVSDFGYAIAVDGSGNAYITGNTESHNFPTTTYAYQTSNKETLGATGFVSKLNSTGTTLLYSTYLGGSGGDYGQAIAVDSSDYAYVTGYSESTDFPITTGAYQTSNKSAALGTVFLAKLNPAATSASASLLYSTYLGGNGAWNNDQAQAIALDSSGYVYLTGITGSTDFPTTPGAYQPAMNPTAASSSVGGSNAFVTKMKAAANAGLSYSTYLGGNTFDQGNGIAVDSDGNAYVAGWTYSVDFPTTSGAYQTSSSALNSTNNPSESNHVSFVSKLNATGTALDYSTFLGGSSSVSDQASAIAVDSAGNAYIAGYTTATDFPTTTGAYQTANQLSATAKTNGEVTGYFSWLNAAGSELLYSTYLGGNGANNGDVAMGVTMDNSGNAYLTGYTGSNNFPISSGAFQTSYNLPTGYYPNFVTKLDLCDATTGMTLTASTSTPAYGETVTFTATPTCNVPNSEATGNVSFTVNGGTAAVVALNSGEATFSTASPNLIVGGNTITASYTGDSNFAAKSASSSVTEAANVVATHFSVSAPSSATAGTSFSVTVTALSSSNATATGYTGTVHFTSGDGAAVLPANDTLANGVGTFSVTLKTAGTQSVIATDTATSSITGTFTILVNPGPATHLVIPGGPEPFYTAFGFNIYAYDAEGNLATSYNGTVAFSSSDPGFANLGPVTLVNGVGTASAVLKTAGTDTITATDVSNSAITGTGSFTVLPGAATYLVVSAPSASNVGRQLTFTITALDLYGNIATGYTGTVHFTTSDTGSGVILPGDYTFVAGDAGVHSFTNAATLVTAGTETITATDAGNSLAGTSGGILVTIPNLVVNRIADDAGSVANCAAQPSAGATTISDSCSLRDALLASSAGGSGSITFDSSVFGSAQTVTLTNGMLTIPSYTTIWGATTGSGATTKNLVTVNGNNASVVFSVDNGAVGMSLNNLIITGGNSSVGGGIFNIGTLLVNNCTISQNVSTNGGGIQNDGTLTLLNSTVSGNSTSGASGGGIANATTLTVINSTVSGNAASGLVSGGGIFNEGTLTVTNSTISGNSANNGGGIVNTNQLTMANSIVSGNTAGSSTDLGNEGTYTDNGGNQITTGVALASLGNYGGPTQTQLPLPGDPSICGGLTSAQSSDQRGYARSNVYDGTTCYDSGAVQTAYAVTFSTEPPSANTVGVPFTPAPVVELTENGNLFTPAAGPIVITDNDSVLSGSTSAGTSSGYASFDNLSVSTAVSGDELMATLTLGSFSLRAVKPLAKPIPEIPGSAITVSATSNAFAAVPASQSITFPAPVTEPVIVGGNASLLATSTSGLPVGFLSGTTSVCTVSGSVGSSWRVSFLAIGQCSIEAYQWGNADYATAPKAFQNFYVHGQAQTITVTPITATIIVGSSVNVAASASSSLPLTVTSKTPTVCSVFLSGGNWLLSGNAKGSCTIVANQTGNTIYGAATAVSTSVLIHGQAQSITFPAIAEPVTVGSSVTLQATASSGLPITYVSAHPTVCTVSKTSGGIWSANLLTIGTCSIAAEQSGNSTFASATNLDQNFYVHP